MFPSIGSRANRSRNWYQGAVNAFNPSTQNAIIFNGSQIRTNAFLAGNSTALTANKIALVGTDYGGDTAYNTGYGFCGIGLGFWAAGTLIMGMTNGGVNLTQLGYIGFCPANPAGATVDTPLYRDAAGVLALRNAANAQTYRLYNTWTDASNYERGIFDWQGTSNVLSIGTEKAGTGSTRNMQFLIGGTNVLDYGISVASAWSLGNAASLYWGTFDRISATNQNMYMYVNGAIYLGVLANSSVPGLCVRNTSIIGFSSGSVTSSGADTGFFRAAVGIIEQRTTTQTQTYRIYNTWTDASNYERAIIDWQGTSNVLSIGTQAAGTGTTRNMQFLIGGTNKLDYGVTTAATWTSAGALTVGGVFGVNQTPAAISQATNMTFSSAADGAGNIGHRVSFNLNGTTYWIPCSTTAF